MLLQIYKLRKLSHNLEKVWYIHISFLIIYFFIYFKILNKVFFSSLKSLWLLSFSTISSVSNAKCLIKSFNGANAFVMEDELEGGSWQSKCCLDCICLQVFYFPILFILSINDSNLQKNETYWVDSKLLD